MGDDEVYLVCKLILMCNIEQLLKTELVSTEKLWTELYNFIVFFSCVVVI